ncbi:aldehyde dehydrogenase family protein [Protaetiibacter larvae]|uniref:Aldehyde dehydrogenase n=1 Tax=Protaetiibacter larvae TaxID=2592654 RepID=A0A5C1Y5P2_9MICO|nr:aldehyde dehydrogenase family protein [Protaetiibacter larvae]QEO08565.1 aldehyde dehydrogenase [Protaetiibacter larvae]
MAGTTLIDPATEQVIGEVEHTPLEEVDAAVERARVAQRGWAALAPADRALALRRFATVVDGHLEELAQLEVRNSGHPISSARWEAGHVRDVLNYYAGAPERLLGAQIPVGGGIDVTFHEPIGVIGVIVPWNFPMTIASWGFAPALAAGNAVLLKPADWTPLTAIRLGELALESGLPEGLFQVLPGRGSIVGNRFVTHPHVGKVVFTGSTEVGRQVAAGAAERLKPVTLELGGKSANVVFADADLERAAASTPGSVFDNAGQDCCARSRLLVERSVLDRFLELLEPAVKAFRVGAPGDEATEMGPLVSATHRDAVASFLDDTLDVAFRGSAPGGPGYWMAPTVVLAGRGDRIATEEVFGPVLTVLPFEDEADAIALANSSIYGLSGSIWTNDLGRGIRVARGVQSGTISVNSHSSVRYTTPFGGMKASGLGRELGPDAPLAFTETKNVFFATSAG